MSGAAFNADEVVGPAVFWAGVMLFLLAAPLRGAAAEFSTAVRSRLGATAFIAYMAVHLLLYGFIFDVILAAFYGESYFSTGADLLVATNLFSPPSLIGLASNLAYNPIIEVSVPPIFSTALSFYSIAIAVVIAVLVVANIGRTRELAVAGAAAGKARAFLILPVVGIVFGASCCLSVAGLISLASPAATVLAASPWIYYVTYFLFPCLAIVLLYLNLRSMRVAGLTGPRDR